VIVLLALSVDGFVPSSRVVTEKGIADTSTSLKDSKIQSIAHELQELDNNQKAAQKDIKLNNKRARARNDHLHDPDGFVTYHESLVHKLRRTIYEKDMLLQEALDDLEDALVTTNTAFEMAQLSQHRFETEHKLYEDEHESIRRLLWQAVKLSGRRIKNGLKRFIPFGRRNQRQAKP
jgi:hypothetical protein